MSNEIKLIYREIIHGIYSRPLKRVYREDDQELALGFLTCA